MEHYFFSGGITRPMVEYLLKIPEFKPIDTLVSQLDRNSVDVMIELIHKGVVKSLFIDSGAFSQYTQKVDKIDVEEYCEYVNGLDEYISLVAQVDTLPGKMWQPKKPEDYVESARLSWENYLYMRTKLKSPEKLIAVFHFGESMDVLKNMLEWRGPNGEVVNVIGLSPANDTHQNVKDAYLKECYDVIRASSRPDAKTHLFGVTSMQALAKFPCWSCDSTSHRLRTAYNKVYTRKWGTVPLSDRSRTTKVKSNASFLRLCDESNYKEFKAMCNEYGFEPEQLPIDNAARVVVDIMETQRAVEGEYKYNPKNLLHSKKLFNI